MSWMQKLHKTYETCVANPDFLEAHTGKNGKEVPGLMPVSHTSQQAHICVLLDVRGNFRGAEFMPPKTQIIIPATEDSAGRSGSKVAPHPLIDKIHYCAADYRGKKSTSFARAHEAYFAQLSKWCDSAFTHPMICAVRTYLEKGTLVHDLVGQGLLHADESGNLLTEPPGHAGVTIFTYLSANSKTKKYDQGDAMVCWRVASARLEDRTWNNRELQALWIQFDAATMEKKALCMLAGATASITSNHPRNIRRPGDGAKLISSNDEGGFTFRGRFLEAGEACTIGYEASHKVHNVLRWLISRQGYRTDQQVVVAWVDSGAPLPGPCEHPLSPEEMFFDMPAVPSPFAVSVGEEEPPVAALSLDAGQVFSRRLAKALRGYRQNLPDATGVAILALDAASLGRLAVTFYREQALSDYLSNLEKWQLDCAWPLPVRMEEPDAKGKRKRKEGWAFIPCAPLPETIARVAYGGRVDDKLRKTTVERLLPCIVEGSPLPRDLVECCVRRACNRPRLEAWGWPEVLGTACAVYKGYFARRPKREERRTYTMALDEERCTRDYLYGRLLAVAEYVERTALKQSGENRPTNAERLMQRFADHPCATWRQIRLHLEPYLQRLQNSAKGGWLPKTAKKLMQEISDKFRADEFISPYKLSGEFLLGYHCQMSVLYAKREMQPTPDPTTPTHEGAPHEPAAQN